MHENIWCNKRKKSLQNVNYENLDNFININIDIFTEFSVHFILPNDADC